MKIGQQGLGALVGLAAWLSAATVVGEPSRSNRPSGARSPNVISAASKGSESARRSLVVVERDGRPLSLGFILADDGRILTARSPLGDTSVVEIRFADGARSRARLQHEDADWDLALLAPAMNRQSHGLAASEAPSGPAARLTAFTAASHRPQAVPVLIRGRTTFLGQESRRLDALELAASLGPSDLGTPIVDETGAVVALATRGCLLVEGGGGEACLPIPVGAPVAVLRRFLSGAKAPLPPQPWLGARVVADATPHARGVRIQAVQPRSPADEARLRGGPAEQGDLVVAVDGHPVTSPEALAEAIRSRSVGDSVMLLVLAGGQFREVPVVLRAAPPSSGTD